MPLAVTVKAAASAIDQLQTDNITATVANDSKNAGVTWTVSGGGTLSGSTTTAATYNAPNPVTSTFTATITATSITDATKTATAQVTVNPPPTITTTSSSLPAVTPGTAYNATLAESGGTGPFTWSITTGTLPLGLSLAASTGVVSGMPSGGGSGTVTFEVTDSSSAGKVSSGTVALNFTVNAVPTMNILPATLPGATVGTPYSVTMSVTGGVAPYTWSLTNNPSWLSINASTGVLSGTPTGTSIGTITFSFWVTDSETPKAVTANTGGSITVSAQPGCTNTLLNGSYAVMLEGWKGSGRGKSYVGSFTADGAGNITNGTMDIADQGHSAPETDPFTGTYCVGSNNLALLTLNSGGNTVVMEAALDSVSAGISSNEHIMEYDTSGELNSGILRKQDTTAFSTSKISGKYAFAYVGVDPGDNRFAIAGQFSADGSGNLSGVYDGDDVGTLQTNQTLTANDLTVASTGRGTVTITTNTGNLNYVFYVVSASEALVMAVDTATPPVILAGRALQQSGTFTDASLNGISVYESEGVDIKNTPATPEATLAFVTTTGTAGTFTFTEDVNDGGTVATGTDSGTYSVSANGRVTVTGTANHEPVLYLISQNQAFVIGTNGAVDFGTMTPQSGSTFTNASLSGNYMGGGQPPVDPNVMEEVDSLNADGVNALTGTSDQNSSGVTSSTSISGTYAVSSNGRVLVTQSSVEEMIIYIVSSSQFVSLNTQAANPKVIDFHQ